MQNTITEADFPLKICLQVWNNGSLISERGIQKQLLIFSRRPSILLAEMTVSLADFMSSNVSAVS